MKDEEIILMYRDIRPTYEKLKIHLDIIINNFLESFFPNEIFALKSRIKDEESFITKARQYSDPFNEINDILGFAIICYLKDQGDLLMEKLAGFFEINLGACEDFSWDLKAHEFGHRGIKAEIRITQKFIDSKKLDPIFLNLSFEIQISTSIMYTWSKIGHDWYKWDDKYPKPKKLMTSLYAINGLLELADSELSSIQTRTNELKNEKYNIENEYLDVDKLEAFIDTYFCDGRMYPANKNAYVRSLADLFKKMQENDFKLIKIIDFYKKNSEKITVFELKLRKSMNIPGRWSPVGIVNLIIDLMNPEYAYGLRNGSEQGENMLQQYEIFRKSISE